MQAGTFSEAINYWYRPERESEIKANFINDQVTEPQQVRKKIKQLKATLEPRESKHSRCKAKCVNS